MILAFGHINLIFFFHFEADWEVEWAERISCPILQVKTQNWKIVLVSEFCTVHTVFQIKAELTTLELLKKIE